MSAASPPQCGAATCSFPFRAVRPDRWTALFFWNKLLGASRARRRVTVLVLCCAEFDMPENSERFVLPKLRPPEGGPERYAPPDRRPPENHAAVEKVVTLLAKQQPEASAESASTTEHLDVMIRRIGTES